MIQGKAQTPVAELHAGDLGVVAKLRDTLTGDTLGDKSAPIVYPKVKLAEPAISFAVEPKSRGDEDKLSTAIHRMLEEDQLLRFSRDAQTKEFLISGSGQQHLEVAVSKLKRRFNLEVTLKAPKVPYRETIRGKADAQGKHKKQTGGHGQYGDCKIKLEPLARGAGFEFVNDIFGGAIWRVTPGGGSAQLWASLATNPLLVLPDGVKVFDNAVYTSIENGKILRIPINPDGSAGYGGFGDGNGNQTCDPTLNPNTSTSGCRIDVILFELR